jgi:hypothetical protein
VIAEIDLSPGAPIGSTGAFLQSLSGEVNNLATSVEDPIKYSGGIDFTISSRNHSAGRFNHCCLGKSRQCESSLATSDEVAH